mmetsp:Transcript_19157/g.73313  ORF Transcript_19157/g.73313 Transcript_19157/m.73313 type:complete len:279 (-) Transcript_19157:144-980(-)
MRPLNDLPAMPSATRTAVSAESNSRNTLPAPGTSGWGHRCLTRGPPSRTPTRSLGWAPSGPTRLCTATIAPASASRWAMTLSSGFALTARAAPGGTTAAPPLSVGAALSASWPGTPGEGGGGTGTSPGPACGAWCDSSSPVPKPRARTRDLASAMRRATSDRDGRAGEESDPATVAAMACLRSRSISASISASVVSASPSAISASASSSRSASATMAEQMRETAAGSAASSSPMQLRTTNTREGPSRSSGPPGVRRGTPCSDGGRPEPSTGALGRATS